MRCGRAGVVWEVWFVRNGLIIGAVVVAMCVGSLAFAGGAVAQEGAWRMEPAAGVVVEGLASRAEVWLEEPASTRREGELRAVQDQSGSSWPSTIAEPDSGENEDLVPMVLATFGVAAATMVVGLVAYLVRARLGLVKPAPPREEPHGSD